MFGKRLRALRLERGMTQQELGDAVHIARATIAGYESTGKEPDLVKLREIAEYFDVTVDYLVGNSDDRMPKHSDSFVAPQIVKTLSDMANSNASVAEILDLLPGLDDKKLNRILGYIQALRGLPDESDVTILEKMPAPGYSVALGLMG